ncbi:MAG: hypothetical protein U1A77_14405 [Pirellulales bacterium]
MSRYVRKWMRWCVVGWFAWVLGGFGLQRDVAAQMPEPQIKFLEGHSAPVYGVGYTPDGRLLLSAGVDGTVRTWDRTTGALISTTKVSDKALLTLALSPQGGGYATGGMDVAVRLFDLARPFPLVEWGGLPAQATSLAASQDGRYVLTSDAGGVVRWWDSQTKAGVRDFPGSPAPVAGASFVESQGMVFAVGADGGVRSWKLADAQLTGTLLAPPSAALVATPDGQQVFVAGQDGWLRRLRWPPTPPQTLGTHNDQAVSLAVAANGQWFASGSLDGQVIIYQAADGKPQRTLTDGIGRITQITATGDSTSVIAVSEQSQVKVWSVADGATRMHASAHIGVVTGVASPPKSSRFATVGTDGLTRLWEQPETRRVITGHTQPLQRVALSADGKSLWTLSADKTLRRWLTADGKQAQVFDKLPATPGPLAPSGDNRFMVLGDTAGDLTAWTIDGGALAGTWGAHLGGVTAVARDPQGKGWLTVGADGCAKLWEGPPPPIESLAGLPAPVSQVALADDGKILVAGQADGTVVVWDIAAKKVLHQWPSVAKSPLTSLQLAAGGAEVWVSDQAGQVRAWKLPAGTPLDCLTGGSDAVTSVALHPRDPLLATTSADGEVRLWRRDPQIKVLRPADGPMANAPAKPDKAAAEKAAADKAMLPLLPVANSADGQSLVAANSRGAVSWLAWADQKPLRPDVDLGARPRTLAIRPDGGEFAAGDVEGGLHLVSAGMGAPQARVAAHDGEATGVSYHPGGSQVASAGVDGWVRVWQLPVVAPQSVAKLMGKPTALATSVDGSRLFVAAGKPGLVAAETATEKRLFEVDLPPGAITSLAVSADQTVLGSTDANGGVSVRGATDGVLAVRLHGHQGAARAIAFPPRPAPWVSVGDDGALRVWDTPTPPRVLVGHTGAVELLAAGPNGQQIATVGADKTVRLWNLGDGAPGWTLAHDMPVRALSWKADSQWLATVDAAQRIRVWNLADGQQTAVLESGAAAVTALAWSSDGTLVSATADGNVKFWNVTEKKETATLASGAPLTGLALVAATQTIVTAHADGSLKTWQWADRKPLATFAAGAPIESLAVSGDGKTALIAGRDKSLRLVTLAGGAAGPVIANLPSVARASAWSADSQKFAATFADGSIRVWAATAGEPVDQFDLGPGAPSGIAFAPDGKSVVVGSDDHKVRIARLLAVRKISLGNQPLTSVAFSNDATTVAVGSRDKSVTLWNVTSGAAIRTLAGCGDAVTAVAISPDGTKVYATSLDKQLRVWNLADGQLVATHPQPTAPLSVRVSRDGLRLAVTLADGSTRVVDAMLGRVWQSYPAKTPPAAFAIDTPVATAAWGADNVTIVAAGAEGEIRRLAVQSVAAFPAHAAAITAMAWSPNGQHVVTASADKTIKVHDLLGKPVVAMQGGEFDVVSMALRRDGAQLAAITRDNQLVFWQVANGQLERKTPLAAPATQVAYSWDLARVLVAGMGRISTYAVATGKLLESGPGHSSATSVAVVAPPAGSTSAPYVLLDAEGEWTLRQPRLERVMTGHAGAATSCAFSSDGASLLSGGVDKTVRQWTIANGAAVRSFGGAAEAVTGVAVSSDGTRVVAIGVDKTVRVWNFADAAVVSAVALPAPLKHLSTAPGSSHFAVLGDDHVLRVFDFVSGRETLHAPAGGVVSSIALNASHKLLWTGPELGVRLQSLQTPTQWLADAGKVLVAAWFPDGKQLATCGEDRVIKIWDRTGKLIRSLNGYPVPPTQLAIRPDGAMLAVAGQVAVPYANVLLWNVSEAQPAAQIQTPTGVTGLTWLADGRLAVAGGDSRLRVYGEKPWWLLEDLPLAGIATDLATDADGVTVWAAADHQLHGVKPACRRAWACEQGALAAVAYADDGRLLLTSGQDKSIRIWNAATGELRAVCAGSPVAVGAIAVTRDSKRVAAACADNQIRVWSLAALVGMPAAPTPPANPPMPATLAVEGAWAAPHLVRSLQWNPAGDRLLTASDDAQPRLWQIAPTATPPNMPPAADFSRELRRWAGQAGPVTSVAFLAEAEKFVTTSTDKTVMRWEGADVIAHKAHEGAMLEMRSSLDGKTLVTSGADKLVRIWDANNLQPLRTLAGATTATRFVALSGNGQVTLAGDDTVARLWNAADGKPRGEFKQPAAITAVELSADGRMAYIATADQIIRHWRVETQGEKTELKLIVELKGPASPATRLTLAADQRTLYSTHADQAIRGWGTASGEPRFADGESALPVYSVAFSPDGKLLASGGADRKVRLIDAATGKVTATGSVQPGAIQAIAFAASGKEWASAGADGAIQIGDLEGKPMQRITVGLAGQIHTVAYSGDGSQLFAAGSARSWSAFQRSSLLRTRTVDGHSDTIYRLALSPSGTRLATLDYAGHLAIWDVGSGGVLFHQQLPTSPAFSLAYSPDGVEFAVGTRDPRVLRVTIPPAAR